ncbi:HEAT repeat domain-containing protein [Sedimenticola hydrogenitrophicus]|uniref:HEAT repeat domain-containing protein n=1 Tax=Sedimenticola hydrogenitrophicus TaxID=2967975 RepID=UPI0023B045F5|nr:HEAT repeat domain-containing protein [Sedimenticola hydrogenitrophicus]
MPSCNQTVEALCELIQTGDEADRCHAIRALGALKAESAVTQLIPYLRNEDIDVCVDTADALGKIGSAVAVPDLVEALNNETDGEICASIAEAVGHIGGEAAIQALHRVMNQRPVGMEWESDWDPWWNVQLEAVKALGRLRAESVVDDLERILDDENEQDIENEILRALAQIPNRGVETLIARLQNSERRPQSRYRAARALRYAEPDQAVKALGRALQDSEPEVRAEAAESLAALHATHYLRALLLMLRDPEERVRDAAIRSVLQLSGTGSAVDGLQEALLPLLRDPSSQVRRTLMNALIPVAGVNPLSARNLEAVSDSLMDGSVETASAAASLLGHNCDTAVEPTLLVILQNRAGHPMVRREAALALGRMGCLTGETVEILTQCIGDRQQPVRLAALAALMELDKNSVLSSAEAEAHPRPLEIIISAVRGEITLAPDRQEILEKLQQTATADADSPALENPHNDDEAVDADPLRVPADYNPDAHAIEISTEDSAALEVTQEVTPEPLPEVLADYIQPPSSTANLQLPEKAGRIVQAGEVRQAISTLDAIAMDNVEVTLGISEPATETEADEETQEFMEVVDENINTMKRLRSQRNITPEQDVRRLGARILADSHSSDAVSALVQALSDDDSLLRREAADAIGLIGRRNPATPGLMDAVGILITQLTVGDMEQRVTCARALGNLGNRVALAPLIATLHDEDANVQIQAIGALAQLAVHGADPDEADHMVIRNIPPLAVARELLEKLDSPEMAVRLAASRALGPLVDKASDKTFSKTAAAKIIDSVANWSGEEARPIGQALQLFDFDFCADRLLCQLKCADSSLKRSVYIEILETLLNTNPQQPQQAA